MVGGVRSDGTDGGEEGRVAVTGEITEDSDFAPLLRDLPAVLRVDLSGVRRINSCGVREWIHFVRAVEQGGTRLVLERCSVPFVRQMNMVSNFTGHAAIQSVQVPYLCASCDREDTLLVDPAELGAELPKAPDCAACGSPMDLDDLPEAYFGFRR